MMKQRPNVTTRGQVLVHIFLVHVFCVVLTRDVTSFVINRDLGHNILPRWSRG